MDKAQAAAVEKSIWRYLRKAFAGGMAYGIDWRTLRMLCPDIAYMLERCHDIAQ